MNPCPFCGRVHHTSASCLDMVGPQPELPQVPFVIPGVGPSTNVYVGPTPHRCPRCGLTMGVDAGAEQTHARAHLRDDFALAALPSFMSAALRKVSRDFAEGRGGSPKDLAEGTTRAIAAAFDAADLALAARDGGE